MKEARLGGAGRGQADDGSSDPGGKEAKERWCKVCGTRTEQLQVVISGENRVWLLD